MFIIDIMLLMVYNTPHEEKNLDFTRFFHD